MVLVTGTPPAAAEPNNPALSAKLATFPAAPNALAPVENPLTADPAPPAAPNACSATPAPLTEADRLMSHFFTVIWYSQSNSTFLSVSFKRLAKSLPPSRMLMNVSCAVLSIDFHTSARHET